MMKKSSKQRREEIRVNRLKKAMKIEAQESSVAYFPWHDQRNLTDPPAGAVLADSEQLAHNNNFFHVTKTITERKSEREINLT